MVAHLSQVSDKSFDYVVIGGGTAGLTVAARLVKDPCISVLVLEAGEPNLGDPKILLGGQLGATYGDPKYDWNHMTTPQKACNNRVLPWNRGKGLGGSSAMNFYAWSKPPAEDMGAIECLGNTGWDWDSFFKYSLRAENFTPAGEVQLEQFPHTYNPLYRGVDGPIQTTVPLVSRLTRVFVDGFAEKGVQYVKDAYGGKISGTSLTSANLDLSEKWTRSYAATAYYLPNSKKPNLTVLTSATVTRIVFSEHRKGNDLVATGVEFTHGNKKCVVHARKEVILSAGTIKSPQILELSGIGRRDVLDRVGIPVKLELPGVGENVQDHLLSGVTYELDPTVDFETFDPLSNPDFAKEQLKLQELDEKNRYRYGSANMAFLPVSTLDPVAAASIHSRASEYVKEQKKLGTLPPGLAEQLDAQLNTLGDPNIPDVEFVVFPGYMPLTKPPQPGKNYVTVLFVLQHPWSRGTIHIKSNNALEDPEIDPRYFENPLDLDICFEQAKFIKEHLSKTRAFSSVIVQELAPGPEVVSEADMKEYIRNSCITICHAIGSLSMLPRDKNGVVDPELKVYGTANLRVADLSIVPLHVATHTQTLAYAIGEKLADILKGSK